MTRSRTLTLDDVFTLDTLSDISISPDGTQVAYVIGKSYTEGEHHLFASTIWLVSTTGNAAPRQFTGGAHTDSFPRWSPNGTQLAFLSDRKKAGTLQLYVMSATGGEARALTDAKGGVRTCTWSPDSTQIAALIVDGETEQEAQRVNDRDDAQLLDHDYKFARLWVVSINGGAPRAITPPEYEVRSYAWLGNDSWAISTSATPNADAFVGTWPVLRIREGEAPEPIWQGPHSVFALTSSTDGSALAWLHSGASAAGWVSEVWTRLPDGTPQRLLDDFDGQIITLHWLPGNRDLLVTAMSHTRSLVARVPLATGTPETVLSGYTLIEPAGEAAHLCVSSNARYACLIEDGTHPPDVWVGTLGTAPQQRTQHNAHLADVALGASATISWHAPDGETIEGVLIYPSDYQPGQRYPLVMQLHGGPNWYWRQRFMAGWHEWGQVLAARGYAVLLPNPRGSADRGNAFTGSNQRAWGTGDFGDVVSGVDHVVALGVADTDRIGVGGWSYGGYLSAWTIGHSDRFKAAIVGAGVVDLTSMAACDIFSWLPTGQMLATPWQDPALYQRCSPISAAGAMDTPTLILHGAADPRVPLGQGRQLYNTLRFRKAPVEMVVYPREQHAIIERQHQRDLLTRVCAWYDRWLKPTAPSNLS